MKHNQSKHINVLPSNMGVRSRGLMEWLSISDESGDI